MTAQPVHTEQTYSLSTIKQLIDLNQNTTNFDVSFKVTCEKPFYLSVIDQTTLDSSSEIQYKHVTTGSLSGNIVQDKNVYQNYFLVLKADEPCNCNVELTKKEIEGKKQFIAPPKPKHTPINWKFWIMIILLIAGGSILYFTVFSKKKDSSKKGYQRGYNGGHTSRYPTYPSYPPPSRTRQLPTRPNYESIYTKPIVPTTPSVNLSDDPISRLKNLSL